MTTAVSKGPHKARSSPGPFSSRGDSDSTSKSPRRRARESESSLTLEEENDLRQFLKLVRGVEWGCKKRKKGHTEVSRVIEKLKAIGVSDVSELLRRVSSRKINEDLAEAGYPRFSKDTLESIRKQSSFIRALEHLNEANYRQVGPLAPAPQMLSSRNLVYRASQTPSGLRSSLSSARLAPEASATGSQPRRQLEDSGALGDPGAGVPSSFLHLRSEDTPTEDGLAYRPLHLRGTRQPKARLVTQAASLPDLLRPNVGGNQARLSTESSQSRPERCPASPSGETERTLPVGRIRISVGNLSAAPSENSPKRNSNSPTGGSSPTRSRSVGFKVQPAGVETPRLMEKLMRASSQMGGETRAARWTSLSHSTDSLVQHGEAMLREQAALEARTTLFREMEAEGVTSPLRQHIARKIRGRLREEQERDGQGTLDQVEIQQRCINIRKHLGLMSNLRRELQVLKRNAFEEEDESRSKKEDDPSAFLRGAWMAKH